MRSSSSKLGLVVVALGASFYVACSGGSGQPIDPPVTSPNNLEGTKAPGAAAPGAGTGTQAQGTVDPPAPKVPDLEVSASIISATLGDDCGTQEKKMQDGLCAPSPDGNGCGFACQQSNVQLSFKTGAGTPAKVTIVAVTLHDVKNGTEIDKLVPRSPQRWADNGYTPWDEMLAPSSEVRASYDLSAPKWSTPGDRLVPLWRQYRMHVILKVGEQEITLESTILDREPPVTT